MTSITPNDLHLTSQAFGLTPIEASLLKEFRTLHNANKRIFLSIQTLCIRVCCKKSSIHAAIARLKSFGLITDSGWYKRVRVRALNPSAFTKESDADVSTKAKSCDNGLFRGGMITRGYRDNSDMWADESTTPNDGYVEDRLLQNMDTNINNKNINNNKISNRPLKTKVAEKIIEFKGFFNNKNNC